MARVIEIFGLPGSGKSTINLALCNKLKNENIKCEEFSTLYNKYQYNNIKKIYLTIYSLIKSPLLCFRLFKYKKFNFKSIGLILYTLRLFNFQKTRYFKIRSNDYDIIISDQYLLQQIASIQLDDRGNINYNIVDLLISYMHNQINTFIFVECDKTLSFARIRQRNNQKTRFDFWDDATAKINLKNMDEIFDYEKSKIKDYITINANSSTISNISKIIDSIYE